MPEMLQRPLGRVALHVGLPHKQIDFQRPSRSRKNQSHEQDCQGSEMRFHNVFLFWLFQIGWRNVWVLLRNPIHL